MPLPFELVEQILKMAFICPKNYIKKYFKCFLKFSTNGIVLFFLSFYFLTEDLF